MDQYLFQHTDHEGDRLFVRSIVRSSTHPGYLIFGSEDSEENEAVAVRHDRHVVQDLYRAIGRWLDDECAADPSNVAQTAADPEPIYTALIRRLVTEEVARVLPLHQTPQAAVPDPYCHIPNCGWGSCNKHPDGCKTCVSDPEPHDVGHAEAPAKPHPTDWSDALFGKAEYEGHGLKFDYCVKCGHGWGAHVPTGAPGRGCTAQLGKDRCACTRVRGGDE